MGVAAPEPLPKDEDSMSIRAEQPCAAMRPATIQNNRRMRRYYLIGLLVPEVENAGT